MKKHTKTITFISALMLAGGMFSFKSFKTDEFSNYSPVNGDCPTLVKEKSSGGINGYTGSPADGGTTCLSCHGGGATTPQINLTATPSFVNNTYVPGQTYTITYQVTGYPYFGFNLEINDGNSANASTAGTLTAGTNSKIYSGTPSCVSHKSKISSASTATFTWVAPINATNSIYIYSVGLGVNGTGNDNGDKQATSNLVLTAASNASVKSIQKEEMNWSASFVNQQLAIRFVADEQVSAFVKLIDLSGNEVLKNQELATSIGENNTKIQMENTIHSGVYIVVLTVNNVLYKQKIYIQ